MGTLKRKLSGQTLRAVRRYGHTVDALAERRYGISGEALLAKLVAGESGDDPNAVSSAGARGRTQFMPGTRRAVIQKYGIDPWGSADEAVHAAELHLRGKLGNAKGLEGYNPGDPNYPAYILGQKVGDVGGLKGKLRGGSRLGQSQTRPSASAAVSPADFDPGAPPELQLAARQRAPLAGVGQIAPPSFSAQPVLPQGFQPVGGGGGPAPAPDPSAGLSAEGQAVDLGGGAQPVSGPRSSSPGRGAAKGARGRVKLAPMADRPGVPTRPEVIDFLKVVSGEVGRTLTIGTGSRHDRMTVAGNVSDHWEGRGADVPATGRRLIELGQAALIAAGMPVRKARKQTGGLYNVKKGRRTIQIIFNTNGPDVGDHTTHLHVGLEG